MEEDEPMQVKKEVTRGNLWSILTTLLSFGTVLVTITLAYASLSAKNELQDMEIARMKHDITKVEAATIATAKDIGVIQGDIRVIRQILESNRGVTVPPR